MTAVLPADGRLGNQMFAHASLLGIARRNDFFPIISSREFNEHLLNTFNLETPWLPDAAKHNNCSNRVYADWLEFTELLPCTYDHRSEDIRLRMYRDDNRTKTNVLLSGYLQSWRYFDDIREDIIREFRFRAIHRQVASNFLQDMRRKYCSRLARSGLCLTIGVHVRLSDMASEDSQLQGYTTATEAYILNAMAYMERRFNTSRIIYVISSDNMTWCQTLVRYTTLQPLVFFSQRRHVRGLIGARWPDSVNLALLAACDHSIITVGTFGWWGGYLAGGVTVYYKDFPLPGSMIDKVFRSEDYYPPGWIGMR